MKLIKGLNINAGHQLIWINDEAEKQWSHIIDPINEGIQRTEIEAVRLDKRDCGTVTADPREAVDLIHRNKELIFHPIQAVKKFKGFAHRHGTPAAGEDFYIYYVYSKSKKKIDEFQDAYDQQDHIKIGKLLGFPACCGEFFQLNWQKGFIDPIYQAALNSLSEGQLICHNYLEISNAHPYSNPLLRYIGIRAGFHIPCSFHCKESIKLGKDRIEMIEEDLRPIADALLSMPMEWNALHGIAEIRTPIFWIVTASMPTEEKYTVKIEGSFNPREAIAEI